MAFTQTVSYGTVFDTKPRSLNRGYGRFTVFCRSTVAALPAVRLCKRSSVISLVLGRVTSFPAVIFERCGLRPIINIGLRLSVMKCLVVKQIADRIRQHGKCAIIADGSMTAARENSTISFGSR